MNQPGSELIAAYSLEARGRGERLFRARIDEPTQPIEAHNGNAEIGGDT